MIWEIIQSLSGFLAEFGLKVGQKGFEKLFGYKGEAIAEKLGKFRTKNYQANIYDFKTKYKGKIVN